MHVITQQLSNLSKLIIQNYYDRVTRFLNSKYQVLRCLSSNFIRNMKISSKNYITLLQIERLANKTISSQVK